MAKMHLKHELIDLTGIQDKEQAASIVCKVKDVVAAGVNGSIKGGSARCVSNDMQKAAEEVICAVVKTIGMEVTVNANDECIILKWLSGDKCIIYESGFTVIGFNNGQESQYMISINIDDVILGLKYGLNYVKVI